MQELEAKNQRGDLLAIGQVRFDELKKHCRENKIDYSEWGIEIKNIKICPDHQDYQVPLILAFSFPGSEYWCPYCGHNYGMLGAGDDIEETLELKERAKLFKDYASKYLHAQRTICCAMTKWKGKAIKPEYLPREEKERLKQIRADYSYKQRIEEIRQ